MRDLFITVTLTLICFEAISQSTAGMKAIEERKALAESSILKEYPVRNIGPVVQSARVTDIAVSKDPKVFYISYASGGIYKTINNGITQEPIFDDYGALNIGDLAIAPSNDNILYVGTGENNSSRSSYAGSGIYKSTNAGASWEYIGLPNIHHTGRIIVHPTNPDVVWVAALGALYSHNEDRGIYKSTDGGKNWKKKLYVNDSTGFIDLLINPANPKELWASSWERTRKAGDFKGQGIGSSIYKSADAGETWTKSMSGFPKSENNGRIGLDICISKPNVLYAIMDNQEETKEKKKKDKGAFSFSDFNEMSRDEFLKIDDKKFDKFLKGNGFPKKYSAKTVKGDIQSGKYTVGAIANYSGDANKNLFDTKVTGAEVYRSDDSGTSWKKMNSYHLEGVYYTYGYYFGEIRVSPDNEDEIYIFGVPMLTSKDGGVTFKRLADENVHGDHQAFWIDPNDTDHQLLGNDGGLYISYDRGANWLHMNNASNGQFYTVNVDMEKPYNVYGGLQDNGVLTGSSKSIPNKTKKWDKIFGGDGMFVAPDPRNHTIVYTGFQFGNYYRLDRANGKQERITPKHDIGHDVLRFNWRTPVVLSKHNPDIVYFGAQKLLRSMNQGENWEEISDDLTNSHSQGNVPYSTITCIAESPLKFGAIYIGTDDGNIQLTKDGGASWELVSKNLPQDLWVSSISASPHKLGVVYATLTGYRLDDFKSYIYRSDNYGKTWKSLKSNLPDEAVNIIVQDPVNEDLLYLGTDHATYLSMDNGSSWSHLPGIPNVASYDMVVHPRENELVIATHGRSIYVMDVKPLQGIATDTELKLFTIDSIAHSDGWGKSRLPYLKPNEPEMSAMYYLASGASEVSAEIYNKSGRLVTRQVLKNSKGFHTFSWDLKRTLDKKGKTLKMFSFVEPGKYTVKVKADGKVAEAVFDITSKE